MLSDEEVKQQIDYELNIKLKAMEETEKRMIDKLTFFWENFDRNDESKKILIQDLGSIIKSFRHDFNEKWFK